MKIQNRWLASTVAAASLLGALPGRAADNVILVPDQTVAGLSFSAMQINYAVPALSSVITAPQNVSASVNVTVLLFEKPDSAWPYATVTAGCQVVANLRNLCNPNNGQQNYPQIPPQKVELQVIVSNATTVQNLPIILKK